MTNCVTEPILLFLLKSGDRCSKPVRIAIQKPGKGGFRVIERDRGAGISKLDLALEKVIDKIPFQFVHYLSRPIRTEIPVRFHYSRLLPVFNCRP